MTNDRLPHSAAEMVQGHIRHKRWYRLVSALACVVVFCVTYALIMPALTLTGDPHCGLEEHTHGETCYTRPLECRIPENHEHTGECFAPEEVYVCGLEETDGHSHTGDCYSEQPCCICGQEEGPGHSHGDGCWQTTEVLSCGQEETDGHSHGPECYTQTQTLVCTEEHDHTDECCTVSEELICTLAETPAHHHNGDCCTAVEELICTLAETPGHTHDDSCMGTELVLSCGMQECEPHSHTGDCCETQLALVCQTEEYHTHTDDCYGEAELSCGLDEHRHGESCYSDPEADVETAADWERTLAGVELSGEWPADVLAVAESQLGYTESTTNYIIDESGARKGYTRYGAWYGVPYGDWCAMYVSFCLRYANVPAESVPRHSGCRSWVELLRAKELYYPANSDYEPQRGDIVFFDVDGCGLADHVGLVVSVEGGCMTTIEGNTGNCVAYRSYALSDSRLYGIGSLAQAWQRYNEPVEEEEPDWRCGIAEHSHDETCFDEFGALVCALGEHSHTELCLGPHCGLDEHSHTAACFDASGAPVCTLYEHSHAADCYGPQCGLEEHIHSDGCFDELGAPVCTLGEHTHAERCLGLQCGLDAHTHESECFDASGALICACDEHTHTALCHGPQCGLDVHIHTADCLDESLMLVCGLDEHIHDERCLMQPLSLNAAMMPAPVYYCGLGAHTHAPECFDESGALVCALEEHTHTDDCLTEPQPEPAEELEAAVAALEALETLSENDRLAAEALMERLRESYLLGGLTDEQYAALCARVLALLNDENETVAEAAEGTNWIVLRDSGWFEAYADAGVAAMSLDEPMLLAAAEEDTSPSSQQVNNPGGENSQDGVTVSKTIKGTDLENVFDITLTVQTPQKVDEVVTEPDMAVVIVMDISNTMKDNFGDSTRYKAAMDAAEDFLDKFADQNELGVSKIGYVAFNTDAHQIFDLQSCTDAAQAKTLKNTMRTSTGTIINAEGYARSGSRYTNMEAGLKMARDMLAEVSNKNKFVIFLSDGFPTTYVKDGYSGYNPIYTSTDNATHNYIRDDIYPDKAFPYGTNYSDRGAVKAREMATAMKKSGITIFSIGVDVSGQSLDSYITQSANNNFSTMDRTSKSYDIGGTTTGYFTAWLQNSIGSGKGYYYDSANTAGLKDAYAEIFKTIQQTVETSTKADWVATDPIPVQPGNVEFIGLYDKTGTLLPEKDGAFPALTGEHKAGAENTAAYALDTNSISWDLKKSGYTESGNGGSTICSYMLKYRVRLKNEIDPFNEDGTEGSIYVTNGTTTLQYRVAEMKDGKLSMSEPKSIDFPIPSVHGYLGEFEFIKKDNRGNPLAGAEFTLSHSDTCLICRGDETPVTIKDQAATSDANGKVSFANIPSGHKYTLTETKVPPGYSSDGRHYTVVVAYNMTTVLMYDYDQKTLIPWDGVIVNYTSYELPQTGGVGTVWLTAAGAALLLGGAIALMRRRKRADET